MSELLITSSLDQIGEGQVFEHGLPRHVTIWQYFNLPDFHLNKFIAAVGNSLEAFSPLEIVGAEEDEFGPNNDVRVRRVKSLGRGATLEGLHAVLGSVIEQYDGTILEPKWAYEGYNPHITYVDGRALDKDERDILTTVELIQRVPKHPTVKIVRKLWQLEEA